VSSNYFCDCGTYNAGLLNLSVCAPQ